MLIRMVVPPGARSETHVHDPIRDGHPFSEEMTRKQDRRVMVAAKSLARNGSSQFRRHCG
jgi:hypothetical protein